VADDVGGKPFSDGDEPDSRFTQGADDEFAAVVLDEDFVRSAVIHEPSAIERMVAAAEARAEAEAALEAGPDGPYGPDTEGVDPDYDEYGPYGQYGGRLRPYRGHLHWQRPVALLLAVVMGVGIVALVFTAVYRSGSSGRDDTPPPSGPQSTSTSADSGVPEASAVPR
jgi:hypothetical protein